MKTLQETAQYIQTLNPNLSTFLSLLERNKQSELKADIESTTDVYVRAFKSEIALTHIQTHNSLWFFTLDRDFLFDCILPHVKAAGLPHAAPSRITHSVANRYDVYSGEFKDTVHILSHITTYKPFVTKYLWNKTRVKQSSSLTNKKLTDDDFSLMAFKIYLSKLPKGISSIQAKEYFNKISSFELERKEEFIELIMSHCHKPSIELQKNGPFKRSSTNKIYKHMSMNRWDLMHIAHKYAVPVPFSILDESNSTYKPFVTNCPRTPTTELNELSALVYSAILFNMSANDPSKPNKVHQYFADCIADHLKLPEYKEPLQKYISNIKLSISSLTQFIDTFKD